MATKARNVSLEPENSVGSPSGHEHRVEQPQVPYGSSNPKGDSKRRSRSEGNKSTRSQPTPLPPLVPFQGSVADVISSMRSGTLGGSIIPDVADRVGVSQDRLFKELRLPRSTMKARITRNAALSAIEQDRIYRVEKVLARAHSVFEDNDAARTWISQNNRSLGGVSPLSLLDTEAGYELVLDTLGRIEYGVIS